MHNFDFGKHFCTITRIEGDARHNNVRVHPILGKPTANNQKPADIECTQCLP